MGFSEPKLTLYVIAIGHGEFEIEFRFAVRLTVSEISIAKVTPLCDCYKTQTSKSRFVSPSRTNTVNQEMLEVYTYLSPECGGVAIVVANLLS